MKHLRLGTILGAVVVVVVGAGIAASSAGDPQRTVTISKDQAARNVLAFAGDTISGASDLSVDDPRDGAFDRFFAVQGRNLSATVDVNDGRITSLLYLDRTPTSSVVQISADSAAAAATAFLSRRQLTVSGVVPTAKLVDHGAVTNFQVVWQRIVGGVVVPEVRQLSVNPSSGAVFAYADTSRPYTMPPEPKVSRDMAVAIATPISGLGDPTLDSVTLQITFDLSGGQHLSWLVALSSPVPVAPGSSQTYRQHRIVSVDAISGTGEVVATG